VVLDDDDIRRLADAVAARLADAPALPPAGAARRYVDAATLARIFGVDRDWVYAHQDELDVIRLPSETGRRRRLRFDVERVADLLRHRSRPRPVDGAERALGKASVTTRLIEYDDAA
jgi:hypothetical protein